MSETATIPDAAIVLDTVQLRLGNQSFEFNDQIASGKITAITGMSGSGKSTLLNLIAGFETPDQGRIRIGSEDITDMPPPNVRSPWCSRTITCLPISISPPISALASIRLCGLAQRIGWR